MLRFLKRPSGPESTPVRVAGVLTFRCNVCGALNELPASHIDREAGNCLHCGACVRFRSMMAVLTERLLGRVISLDALEPNAGIRGIGMSDAHCYATRLADKWTYTNTYYHQAPLLDISKGCGEWAGQCDFVISSDVFEHVAPPVQMAFDHLHGLLKPGGVAVFSVPFVPDGRTREHFPDLHDYHLVDEGNGRWLLKNTTREGVRQEFRDLVFHGGPGSTLEMRLFTLGDLRMHFAAAGFSDVKVHGDPMFEHGILWSNGCSLTISAIA